MELYPMHDPMKQKMALAAYIAENDVRASANQLKIE